MGTNQPSIVVNLLDIIIGGEIGTWVPVFFYFKLFFKNYLKCIFKSL